MCHYCGALTKSSGSMEKLENEKSVKLDGRSSVRLCQFCGEVQDDSTSLISPAAALQSSNSSVSCCSECSVDANSDGRVYLDESNTHTSKENSGPAMWTGRDAEHMEHGNCEEAKNDKIERDDEGTSSIYELDAQFWLPPDPEDRDDDMENSVANYDDDDDDDDECGDGMNWGKPTSLISFGEEGSGIYKFKEEKQKALEEVMNGKFKVLVNDLLKSLGVDSSGDSWVDIVTSLSWEAASFVRPDAAEGKAMDPNVYVKIKCIATGSRSQSQFIKGMVFKKHAALKHMPTKYDKPKLLLIQGALGLSSSELSFESMQQVKKLPSSVKSTIEMIERYQPNVILVEKAVSRDIQESILKKGMTLVFDMKLHRLERVARCTGSPILSSDILAGQKLRQCDSVHFERFVEEHATSADGGKRPSKTLMFIEGCPTRLGCTILLMGTNSDELKKVKCVVRCAVIMAYNLVLETSFLLDQKAMFSTTPPSQMVNLTVIDESPSTSAGHEILSAVEGPVADTNASYITDIPVSSGFSEELSHNLEEGGDSLLFEPYNPAVLSGLSSLSTSLKKVMGNNFPLHPTSRQSVSSYFGDNKDDQVQNDVQVSHVPEMASQSDIDEKAISSDEENAAEEKQLNTSLMGHGESLEPQISTGEKHEDHGYMENGMMSSLDSESILVLMSSRNASSGAMCEHSHFSRIKFYTHFDIPLGKFLQKNLLNQKVQCKTCSGTPEAHIFYYAHHNKQLTIQVHCLPMDKGLPGESEGRLWMWSRCGKCKFQSDSSKSTKRVLISTGSRGFSFGKFLELSFSNSSLFSTPSGCGHSFHRDFLYFFGLGHMVAMFKYSAVATYSVSLPPQKLEFSSSIKGEILKKDFENVYVKGSMMFSDVEKSLKAMESRFVGTSLYLQGSIRKFSEIENMLKVERAQFEIDIQSAIMDGNRDVVVYKLLSLNRIRLELLLESCVWDRRLHSLLSTDRTTADSKTIDQNHHTLPGIGTIDRREQQARDSVREDANGQKILERGDKALEDCPDLKVELVEDSYGEDNNTMEITVESCADVSDDKYDLKLDVASSIEANTFPVKEIAIDSHVSGSKEQDESSTSSTFTDSTDLSTAAKVTGNELCIHDSTVKSSISNHFHSGDENNAQSIRLQTDKNADAARDIIHSQRSRSLASILSNIEDDEGWWTPFPEIRCRYLKALQRGYLPKLGSITTHAGESIAYKLITNEGAKLHIPLGSDKYIVSDYEDEVSSIIACALALLKDLHVVNEDLGDDGGMGKAYEGSQGVSRMFSLNSPHLSSAGSLDLSGILSSKVSVESRSSSLDGLDLLDSSVFFTDVHHEVSMGLGKLPGKRKYSVICLYASQFRKLRDRCCTSEVDYIASLSRCMSWDAKGGKSKSLFAKTLDDRLVIKEIKRTEFESFLKFAPTYFEYMNQCYEKGNQTCLAKILGIYQVIVRPTRSGKETRHDLMVMENLSFGRNVTRQYDLKGALHARFNSAGNAAGDVLLDQNFVNDMNISPLYVGTRSKRDLQRAVWNDCGFLNEINVMDYSLLVGVDNQRNELVCGIIDYLRQFTWDKQLENWVKSSLVVPKNTQPTVISPGEYKKRFRKFIDTHFLSVPDHWCSQRSSNTCDNSSALPESDGVSDQPKLKGEGEREDNSSGAKSTAQ